MVEDVKAEQPIALPIQQALKQIGIEAAGVSASGMLGDDAFEIMVGTHP
jgi:hypothetical protein